MKLHILGSAAAEGWPALWCTCDNCRRARAVGGKNIRSRSGAIVDGVIKLDLCPDTYMQALRDGIGQAPVHWTLELDRYGSRSIAYVFCVELRRRPVSDRTVEPTMVIVINVVDNSDICFRKRHELVTA